MRFQFPGDTSPGLFSVGDSCDAVSVILSMIAAADEANVIGGGNKLLWKLPLDFAHMKELTMGKPLIMGRKTHESIGRPLPGRLNIVVTRDPAKDFAGCIAVGSLEEGIEAARASGAEEAVIFGGEQLYRLAMPLVDKIYLTRVHARVEGGDTFFPEIPMEQWALVSSERHEADADHAHAFTFETYERV